MDILREINRKFDELKAIVSHDTYNLTRDDQDSVAWRLRDLQKYICDLYALRKAR